MPGWSQNPFWSDDSEQLELAGLSTNRASTSSSQPAAAKSNTAKKQAPRKRKADGSGPVKKSTKPAVVDLFGETDAEDEIPSAPQQSDSHEVEIGENLKPMRAVALRSFFSQRGSSGYTTQRDPVRSGEYYIELRIYNSKEAEREPCDQRWKLALITLKTCADSDSAVWKAASTLVKAAKQEFKSIQPIMYPIND